MPLSMEVEVPQMISAIVTFMNHRGHPISNNKNMGTYTKIGRKRCSLVGLVEIIFFQSDARKILCKLRYTDLHRLTVKQKKGNTVAIEEHSTTYVCDAV